MNTPNKIGIVATSGPWKEKLVLDNLSEDAHLCKLGCPPEQAFPFHAGTPQERFDLFFSSQKDHEILWAVKGGYGASDLLPLLAKSELEPERVLIGCSDVTALFPLLSYRGWHCVHAGMPGFRLYDSKAKANIELKRLCESPRKTWGGELSATAIHSNSSRTQGSLFCGNLAVLTSLIGTPYLKQFTKPTILVIEDIGENPGRIVRLWTQWQHSKMLKNVVAVVLGRFTDMPGDNDKQEKIIHQELQRRSPDISFYVSDKIGHIAENYPLLVGADASLENGKLIWQFPK